MAYCQLEKMVILAVLMLWKFTEGQECHNLVPGLDRQSRGVDAAMLDLLPLDFNRPDGYKARIIEYTCTQNKTMELNEVTYQIPDQVSSLDNIPSGWLTSQVNIFRSYDEVKASMSRNAGGGLLIRKFGFSRSTSYTEIQHSLVSSLQYIEQVTSFESATRVDHLPYWNLQLGPTVMEFINSRLTSSFQENPDAYEEFINYFGTHYFKSAKFGGLIMMLMKTSSEYYLDRRVSDVINQAEASFSTFLTGRGVRTQTGSIVDERFRQLTSTTVRYFGGNTNLLSNSGLSEWQPTVLANPWLFSAELAPITDLITDTTKRQSMESAITNHLLHGYLQELERLLTVRRSQWNAATSTLEGLLTQVQAAKAVRILNQTSIEDLGVNVKEQVTVPTWFTEQTHLCFEWYPDEGLDECSAPQRLLCSLPNTNMSFFLDDTDNSRGGCQMRWGITATGHPEWFEQVGVCYRWQTNGDGRQCNGMANGEYCAPVNSYTTFYRDDTFKLAGGCQMSWRLVVQDSAPAWAHNIQLCFDWFAQQDGYQCGQGASYNLCALANQWTAYYLDDTDNRKGGCYMRWSLKFH